ncbi:MAG TPA: hypothetical protein VJH37_05415 [Candidatus Nanoarchaeia archaeon]|nr:hypothetical protein [Candidatus Nanoarchaeia archaeon]
MQVQLFNPTLKTLRLVETKLKALGAVKTITELKEALHDQVSHQAIKACLAYLEEKHIIMVSVSGGIVYAPPRPLSSVRTQGMVL